MTGSCFLVTFFKKEGEFHGRGHCSSATHPLDSSWFERKRSRKSLLQQTNYFKEADRLVS